MAISPWSRRLVLALSLFGMALFAGQVRAAEGIRGTIGIYCMDRDGTVYFWDAGSADDGFKDCSDQYLDEIEEADKNSCETTSARHSDLGVHLRAVMNAIRDRN